VVTVNCEHVLQGETTLIINVTVVDDDVDVNVDAGDAGDGN
jgi:hypothetical protein